MTTPKTPAAGMSEEQWMAQPLHERAALLLEASEKLWEDDARLWPHADRCLKPTIAELRASLRPTAEDGLVEKVERLARLFSDGREGDYGITNGAAREITATLREATAALSGRVGVVVPRELVDGILACMGPCEQFDHHGNCQTHFIQPKEQCWVKLLAAHQDSPR